VQTLWLVVLIACSEPPEAVPPAVPVPGLAVEAPWRVEKQTADAIVLRYGDTGDGVRLTMAPGDRRRIPGVTPIVGGSTLEVHEEGALWPMVALPWPDQALSDVKVEVEGLDLIVKLAGPPFSDVTDLPSATKDPALTWVRVRRRDADWRIVVTGLATLSLPGDTVAEPAPDGTIRVSSAWGTLAFETASPGHAGAVDETRWWWTNRPSLEVAAPYEKTAFTFTPSRRRP
jgi:hypothetical protein